MKKQPELTARTRQNLIDAFWSIYCEKRIERITVGEITKKAGYNRGTFYEYFDDVYDLLEQIENSLLPKITLPFGELGLDVEEQISYFLEQYSEHKGYYVVLLGDNGDPAFLHKLKGYVKTNLYKLLKQRGIQGDPKLDFTIEFILSAMIGVFTHWFKAEQDITQSELIKLVYNLLNNGAMRELGLMFSLGDGV